MPVNPYSGTPYQFGGLSSGTFSLLGNSSGPTTSGSSLGSASGGFTPTSSFITNLRNPTLASGAGALVSAVPGILSGNYAQAAAQAASSYAGGAAGSAAATALGLSGGPVTIAAMLGGLAASTLAGKFFGSNPQRHSAGANLQVQNGLASFQSSGQDRANTQFVDEFINYVAQGANEVLTSYGLTLPDTPDRMIGGPGDPYGGQPRHIGNTYRLAVEDLGKDGQARTLAVVGPTGEKRAFSGQNQAAEAYEYAVTALLSSVPGFETAINQNRDTTPGNTGPEVITPGTPGPRADTEQPIALPKELEYVPEPIGDADSDQFRELIDAIRSSGRGGPTILSLGAAPTELKPQAQQAYYRQRRTSAINQRKARGIRTNPQGLRSRASTAKTILSGA